MHIELIISLPEGSEQTEALRIRVYFSTVYEFTRTSDIFGIFAVMSLGKIYYDPKHSARFGSQS